MVVNLDMYQTLGLATLVLLLGIWMKKRFFPSDRKKRFFRSTR